MTNHTPIPDPNLPPDCVETNRLAQLLLDGLTNWDTPHAQAHRLTCERCRTHLRSARVLLEGVNTFPRIRPSANLSDRILTAVAQDQTKPIPTRKPVRAVKWVAGVCAVAASVFIGWLVFTSMNPQQTSPVAPTQLANLTPPDTKVTPKPLGESARETREAFVNAAKNKAEQTQRQADLLTVVTPKLDGPENPEKEPLAEAKNGASKAIEPFTGTARRAFVFFTPRPSAPPK